MVGRDDGDGGLADASAAHRAEAFHRLRRGEVEEGGRLAGLAEAIGDHEADPVIGDQLRRAVAGQVEGGVGERRSGHHHPGVVGVNQVEVLPHWAHRQQGDLTLLQLLAVVFLNKEGEK